MSGILDESALKDVAIEDKNAVYDREEAQKNADEQVPNIHQRRQQRKANLEKAAKSKSKQKAERSKKAKRLNLEKYRKRDETIRNIAQPKLTEQEVSLLAPSHTLGVKLTKKQRYEGAIKRRELGLGFDASIIEEVERKKMAREEKERALAEIKVEPIQNIKEEPEPQPELSPKPEPKPILTKSAVAIPEPTTQTSPEKTEIRKPAINVPVTRPDGVEAIREQLPIIGEEQRIMETINENDVVVVCGETGSGKTTQIPQFLYEAGYGTLRTKGKIVVTEPRRVAAVNMAKRVAYELGVTFGLQVGYHVRNNKNCQASTIIKFATDGVLLREAEEDLMLSRYSVVIIDEAHERTVSTDVLIGLLSKIVALRRKKADEGNPNVEPLKLIIMSATLRIDDFMNNARLFSKQPELIKIDARQYPVKIHHSRDTPKQGEMLDRVKHTVEEIHERMKDGGILVFLPGKQEILDCVRYFKQLYSAPTTKAIAKAAETDQPEEIEDVEEILTPGMAPKHSQRTPMYVLPFYSLLDPNEQDKVFKPPPEGHRLVVFSTNIAETSVTIPGVRYVVDPGLEKSRSFDFSRGVMSTKIAVISQASADQRAGRAGRTGPGYCFRLYSSAFYSNHFQKYSIPEIQRKPVDEVVLLLKTMGLDDVSKFPFPSLISDEALRLAEETLMHLGAAELEKPHKATKLGKLMAMYPLAPRLSKLLVKGKQMGVVDYAVMIAAAMSVREPFTNTPSEDFDPNQRGDIIRLMNAFGAYLCAKNPKEFAKQYHMRWEAMEEIQAIREQLVKVIEKVDRASLTKHSHERVLTETPTDQQETALAWSIFSAFPDHVARRDDKGKLYTTADGKRVDLRGYSSLYDKKPLWVCYSDIDENEEGKAKLNNVTKIASSWIPVMGSPLYLHTKKIGPAEYVPESDSVTGILEGSYGPQNWPIPPTVVPHPDPYGAFAAALIDGKVIPALKQFADKKAALTDTLKNQRDRLPPRLCMIVVTLKNAQIASRALLEEKWRKSPEFLCTEYLYWIADRHAQEKVQKGWPFLPKAVPTIEQSDSDDSYSD